MSAQSHLQALKQRHMKLDEEIRREGRSRIADDVSLRKMKRQKLLLKEEIERLSVGRD